MANEPLDPIPPAEGCGKCFACVTAGLGLDEDQRVIVLQLMNQAHMAGAAWLAVKLHGKAKADLLGRMLAAESQQIGPESLQVCIDVVMESRSRPMSPEVAAAVRGSHR
jgi:hypothetical protein